MSTDVMRNPPFEATVLHWYKPQHTTPFALCGHIGSVLARLDPDKHGPGVREVWFGEDGWQHLDGMPLDEDDIVAFAVADAPVDPNDVDSSPRAAASSSTPAAPELLYLAPIEDAAGEHRWRLQSRNGQLMGDSGEGYTRAHDLDRAMQRVATAKIIIKKPARA